VNQGKSNQIRVNPTFETETTSPNLSREEAKESAVGAAYL
jgi:hypothetical protein